MKTKVIDSFCVIGISVRTTNENMQAAKDIPALWNRFFSENVPAKIPGIVSQDIYCMYTDYEKDYTRPYTTLLGLKVKNLDVIPEGLTGKLVSSSDYLPFCATGKISDGIVFNEWTKIWNTEINRAYSCDFEVYGEKSKNPDHAEVDIFIAVK